MSVVLNISAEEFQRFYAGTANAVVAKTPEGQTVRFPAHVLRRYVTRDGVQGAFRIDFDADQRFVSISRI